MSNIDILKEKAIRLVSLLDDPHPGLFTWHEALNNLLQDIGTYHDKSDWHE